MYLRKVLVEFLGFASSNVNPCLFFKASWHVCVGAHIDDPLATGPDAGLEHFFLGLSEYFVVKQGSPFGIKPQVYLGREYIRLAPSKLVERPTKGYIERMLEIAGMEKCKPIGTCGEKLDLRLESDLEYVGEQKHHVYRSVVGKGQFVVRPLCQTGFALKELSRRLHHPRKCDYENMKKYYERYEIWVKPMRENDSVGKILLLLGKNPRRDARQY